MNVTDTAPIASQEANYSNEFGLVAVRLPQPETRNCAAEQLEVKTFNDARALSSEVAFTVVVP